MQTTAESIMDQSGRPFTRADLARMPDDGRRYELVDGTLIVSPVPWTRHQRAVARLSRILADACVGGMEVLPGPFGVALAEDTELLPDIVVGRKEDFTDEALVGAPVLAVEVLSPSTRLIDTHVKRERLERAGAAAYRQVADVVGDEAYSALVPFAVRVRPSELV